MTHSEGNGANVLVLYAEARAAGSQPTAKRGSWCRGRWSCRRKLRWGLGRWWHAVWRHVVGGRHSQESRRRRQMSGGAGGLTRPHRDGAGPGVIEQRPTLTATPAGGTSMRGAPHLPLRGRRPASVVEC
jgi:hypothetical protein